MPVTINSDNGFERLLNAVTSMASSAAPLPDRLLNAWITLWPLQPSDFDPGLRERFTALHHRATAVAGPEGSLTATLSTMSEQGLRDLAEGIRALFTAVVVASRNRF